ncbi:DNA cytosine methyltransferase [Leifsonia virtsii]|uniref:DNA (cytosine-5-)-methyltransferase n=2 Tax=Leifsonia TaxID=110932 RepID=A0ABT8J3Z3_9MICO|nr:DNA cytosine methyltransferase [Leifsonia virtsii]MDN4599386.1 DNA cytosine methyltransferase [Leifsonia virtsii]
MLATLESDVTMTDLFAGAGGSSTGAGQVPGVKVKVAANHWDVAIDIHAANHQSTDHAIVDLHQERPSFFPSTTILWASPECTKWSQANGSKLPDIEEGLFEDPLSDEAKTRSRLLMFDVLRFIEHHRYRLVVVENVVDIAINAKYRTAWTVWRQELRALGYKFRVVSLNAMHAQKFGAPAPQSRDRIYVVAWPEADKAPDLDRILRPLAYCWKCGEMRESVQSFKPGRTVGRYRQAYVYCCPGCGSIVEPGYLPASVAIDWSIPGRPIGDRLKPKTRLRVAAGIARYWGPTHLEAAGNTYDAADPRHPHHGEADAYYRSWPITEPLKALHTSNSKALAIPVDGRDGKNAYPVDEALRTQTTRLETALAYAPERTPFIAEMYGTGTARPVTEAAGTFTAGGNHHALVTPFVTQFRDRVRDLDPYTEPMRTAVADGANHALIHRMNGGGAEMTTPATEPMRTLTTAGHQAIMQQPRGQRAPISAKDLDAAMELVPDTLLRMFLPTEVAAGMAFPPDYMWQPTNRLKPVSQRDITKAAGNAVCPPCARDIVGICVETMGLVA